MRKHDHAKIIFACLQTYRGDVTNVLLPQHLTELLETAAGESRQRLRHLSNIAEGEYPAAPVSKLADVLTSAGLFELVDKFRGETTLHRRQSRAPAFRNANHSPPRMQWSS